VAWQRVKRCGDMRPRCNPVHAVPGPHHDAKCTGTRFQPWEERRQARRDLRDALNSKHSRLNGYHSHMTQHDPRLVNRSGHDKVMTRSPSPSVSPESDSEASDFAPSASASPPPRAKRKIGGRGVAPVRKSNRTSKPDLSFKGDAKGSTSGESGVAVFTNVEDIEDSVGPSVHRPHARTYHAVNAIAADQQELLDWFEGVRYAKIR
jgi:hypothetical protein